MNDGSDWKYAVDISARIMLDRDHRLPLSKHELVRLIMGIWDKLIQTEKRARTTYIELISTQRTYEGRHADLLSRDAAQALLTECKEGSEQ